MPVNASGATTISGREGTAQMITVASHLTSPGTTNASGLIYRVKEWSLTATTSPAAWGDSDSNGFTNRKATRQDATGSATVLYNTDNPYFAMFSEGDIINLTLWFSKITAGFASLAQYWQLPRVIIANVNWTVSMDSQEPIEISFDFEADGVFFSPAHASIPSITLATS